MNIGIDIGGSHIGIGLVDKNGNIIKKIEKEFTDHDKNCIKTVIEKTIVDCINNWLKNEKIKIEKIGIGVPRYYSREKN